MNDDYLNNSDTPRKGSVLYSRGKRLLCFLLVMFMLLEMLPMTAWAAWDGSGDISGGMNDVSGTTKFYRDSEHNIVGYRFSIYDADGNKKGHSIDIDIGCNYSYFKNLESNRYWYDTGKVDSQGNPIYDKKSHIDLNREFQEYKGSLDADGDPTFTGTQITLGTPVLMYAGVENLEHYVYVDTSLKDSDGYTKDPSSLSINDDPNTTVDESESGWLTKTKAQEIAEACGAGNFDAAKNYLIVEPLYHMQLNAEYYVLTSAEQAVYQALTVQYGRHTTTNASYQCTASSYKYHNSDYTKCSCGWYTNSPRNQSLTPYIYTLGLFTSGAFLRYLYAEQQYGVLDTKPVTSAHFATSGTEGEDNYMLTLALKDTDSDGGKKYHSTYTASSGAKRYLNYAAGILEFQAGMGIYSNAAYNTKVIVTHWLQNLDGSGYSQERIFVGTPMEGTTRYRYAGTIDTTLTFSNFSKTFTGFTYNSGKTEYKKARDTAWTRGSSYYVGDYQTIEINLYYDRNTYPVQLVAGTGIDSVSASAVAGIVSTSGTTYTCRYGTVLVSTQTTKSGYNFTGWDRQFLGSNTSDTLNSTYPSFSWTVTEKAKFTANASANTAGYKVNHYVMDASGNYPSTPTKTDLGGATVGATLTISDLASGYLSYLGNPAYLYHNTSLGTTSSTVTVVAGGTTTVNLYYERRQYPYSVYHYQQNITDNNYTLVSADTVTGYAYYGATITGAIKSYTGFTCTSASAQSMVIGTGTNNISYYYNRHTYTVKWWNGSTLLETDSNVRYGATPSYNGQTPTKAADAQSSWSFSGWDPAIAIVTSDQNYYAQFVRGTSTTYRQIIQYRLQNVDGSWPASYTVAYDQSIAYGGTVPAWSRAADTYHEAGSVAAYTVTGAKTTSVDIPRKQYRQIIQYRLQNIDGTWPSYSVAYDQTVYAGATVPAWSIGATKYHEGGSVSSYTATQANTYSLDLDRYQYTVTLTAGTGISGVSQSGGYPVSGKTDTYYAGSDVTISASLSSGYMWGSWNGTFYSTSNPHTITDLTENVAETASAQSANYTMYFADNINILTGLGDIGSTNAERMTYSISNGVVTVKANYEDGYGFTTARVYLEAGVTYAFACNTNQAWGSVAEAFFMLNGGYSVYYYMSGNACVFTPSTTGTYWLRLDVNTNGATAKFYNLSVSKVVDTRSVTYGAALGTLPTVSRQGYNHIGWYSGVATRDNTIAWRNRPWIYYADAFGDLYNAFGYNEDSLRSHYLNQGGPVEGRRASEYISTDTYNATSDTVVFAGYDPKVIKLTLDGNGGSGHTPYVYFRYGINAFYTDAACTQQITAITRPTRANYVYNTALGFTGDGTCGGVNGERYIAYDGIEFAGDLCTDIYKDATLYANWIPCYYLDLNGWLDGASSGSISGYGTCDVYINGSLVADDVTDYWTQWPEGTTYEIKDIKQTVGHTYKGVYSGSVSGTISGGDAAVYLQFVTNRVQIAYHPNGGTVSKSGYGYNEWGWVTENGVTWFHSISYGNKDDLYNASSFDLKRVGYTFGGWRLHPTNTIFDETTQYESTVFTDEADSSKNTTNKELVNCYLYAVWNPITYTITYNSNGGTSVASQTYTIETDLTLRAAPTRLGYTFAGWKVTSSGGNWSANAIYNSAQHVGTGMYGNITLTAQWTPNSYTLTYNPNGGTVSPTSKTFNYGTIITGMPTPTRRGYTFGHWYGSFNGSSNYLNLGRDYMYTNALSLRVEAYMDNWAEYATSDMRILSCTEGGGWNIETNNGGICIAIYDAGVGYKNIIPGIAWSSLAPGWHTFEILFDGTYAYFYLDGASSPTGTSAAFSSGRIGYNADNSLFIGAEAGGSSTSPAGCYFKGRVANLVILNSKTRIGSNFVRHNTPAHDFTLYAEWINNVYEISLNKQSGTGGTDTIYELFDIKFFEDTSSSIPDKDEPAISKVTPPTRVGYIFDGYYTEVKGGGDQIIDKNGNILVSPDYFAADDTIYAKWIPITYKIHFDPNPPACIQGTCDNGCICSCTKSGCCTAPGSCNGCGCKLNYSGTMADMTLTYDVASHLTANAFYVLSSSAQRYTFTGWNTKPDGSGTAYANKEAVENLTTVDGATITLYAQWTPKTYTITCNVAGGTGGTTKFYEVFNTKFYVDTTSQNATVKIAVPTREGYVFGGYYTSSNGVGTMIVDAGGTIAVTPTYFTANKTIYAYWLKLDIQATGLQYKLEKDDDAAALTTAELKNIRWKTTLYVYNTYKNNSDAGTYYYGSYVNGVYVKGVAHDLTSLVSGFNSGTKVGDYTLAPGESTTVYAATVTGNIGSRYQTASAYLAAWGIGVTSGTWDNCHTSHNSSTVSEYNATNNAYKVNYTVNFDVELTEIYFADKNGTRLSPDWVVTGMQVYVHHVYKNNSTGTVYVDRYRNDKQYASNIAMAAGATHDVVAGTFTATTSGGNWSETGAIYRHGYADESKIGTLMDAQGNVLTLTKETYETYPNTNKVALDNNVNSTTRKVIKPLSIELVTPDANTNLRAGTDVFVTFEITNTNLSTAFPNNDMIRVTLEIYDAKGNLVKTEYQDTVIPAATSAGAATQLVWFRWTVPASAGNYTIKSYLTSTAYPATDTFDTSSDVRKVYVSSHEETDDTRYEEKQPNDWTRPSKPTAASDSLGWYQWTYNAGSKQFVKKQYGLMVKSHAATITPNSETAYYKDSYWYIKSGYGFTLTVNKPTVTVISSSGYSTPDASWYTDAQWAYALFPEFEYDTDERTTLELIGNNWELRQFKDYGKLHFIPIWYPDNQYASDCYFVKIIYEDVWTPAGPMTVVGISNGFYIEGDMYDDWYTRG